MALNAILLSGSAMEPKSPSLTIHGLRPYQRQMVLDPRPRAVALSAPQVGKTVAGAVWLIALALFNGALNWWTAPTAGQTERGFEEVRLQAQGSGVYAGERSAKGDLEIRLVNGGRIEFRSWHEPENLSSATIWGLVCDEAHLLTRRAHEVLTDRRSASLGPVRYFGNTGLPTGEFRKVCKRASDPDNADAWGFYHWTWKDRWLALGGDETDRGRAYHAEIDEIQANTTPARFAERYLAEWGEPEGAVFSRVAERTVLEPWCCGHPDVEYVVGVDVGQVNDYFAMLPMSVGEVPRRVRGLERFRRINDVAIEQRILDVNERYHRPLFHIEVNGPGRPIFGRMKYALGLKVLPFDTTTVSKEVVVNYAAADLFHGRIELAGLPPLQEELVVYQERKGQVHSSYSAPTGFHDDTVMAFVLANAAAKMRQAVKAAA